MGVCSWPCFLSWQCGPTAVHMTGLWGAGDGGAAGAMRLRAWSPEGRSRGARWTWGRGDSCSASECPAAVLKPRFVSWEKPVFDCPQVARAQHVQAESYLVYSILTSGEIECSNSLEDALDQALPSQAFVYRPVRQRVYALLLGGGPGEWSCTLNPPGVQCGARRRLSRVGL